VFKDGRYGVVAGGVVAIAGAFYLQRLFEIRRLSGAVLLPPTSIVRRFIRSMVLPACGLDLSPMVNPE